MFSLSYDRKLKKVSSCTVKIIDDYFPKLVGLQYFIRLTLGGNLKLPPKFSG